MIEQSLESIRKKTVILNKVSGIFSILAGVCFGLFGLFNFLFRPYLIPLSMFLLVLCVVFIVIGFWYLKAAKAA